MFENVVKYCYDYNTLIPLSFVLGFYVTVVMTRWWNQYISIPFPDPLAVFVSATIHGQVFKNKHFWWYSAGCIKFYDHRMNEEES